MPQLQVWQQDINRTNLQIARGNLSLTSMDATRRVCKSNAKQIDKVKLWEAGEAYPTYRQMEALANIYNVNVFQFFVTGKAWLPQKPRPPSVVTPPGKPATICTDLSISCGSGKKLSAGACKTMALKNTSWQAAAAVTKTRFSWPGLSARGSATSLIQKTANGTRSPT